MKTKTNRVRRNGAEKQIENQAMTIGLAATMMRRGKPVTIPIVEDIGLKGDDWEKICAAKHAQAPAAKDKFFRDRLLAGCGGGELKQASSLVSEQSAMAVALLKLIDHYIEANTGNLESALDEEFRLGFEGLVGCTTSALTDSADNLKFLASKENPAA